MQEAEKSYMFHRGALRTQKIAFILCCASILLLPLGIWIRRRAKTAKLTIDATGVTARGRYSTVRVDFGDVVRFGAFRFRDNGGAIARAAANGLAGGHDELTHLCFRDARGKTRAFLVSTFEREDEIIAEISRRLGKPLEVVKYHHKWPTVAPQAAAAA